MLLFFQNFQSRLIFKDSVQIRCAIICIFHRNSIRCTNRHVFSILQCRINFQSVVSFAVAGRRNNRRIITTWKNRNDSQLIALRASRVEFSGSQCEISTTVRKNLVAERTLWTLCPLRDYPRRKFLCWYGFAVVKTAIKMLIAERRRFKSPFKAHRNVKRTENNGQTSSDRNYSQLERERERERRYCVLQNVTSLLVSVYRFHLGASVVRT